MSDDVSQRSTSPPHDHSGAPSPRCFPPLIDQAIVLTGPTASGKSAAAVALAKRIDAEILSLDSIAVYRGMDIGTAKPDAAERAEVPHHLIDLVGPAEDFSVACYLDAAHQKVDEITGRGKQVIFVGGTPMFLKGVLRGFDPGPPADWTFRQAVEEDVERHGIEALRQRLRQVDPLAAHRIGPNDARRMIRALEVSRLTGVPISHRQVQFGQARHWSGCRVFALRWDRSTLHDRINRRVTKMFDQGWLDEVHRLKTVHRQLSRTASQAVGYRELLEWMSQREPAELSAEVLAEELPSTVVEAIAAHTRQLARRQETWFRSFAEIQFLEVGDPFDADHTADRIMDEINKR